MIRAWEPCFLWWPSTNQDSGAINVLPIAINKSRFGHLGSPSNGRQLITIRRPFVWFEMSPVATCFKHDKSFKCWSFHQPPPSIREPSASIQLPAFRVELNVNEDAKQIEVIRIAICLWQNLTHQRLLHHNCSMTVSMRHHNIRWWFRGLLEIQFWGNGWKRWKKNVSNHNVICLIWKHKHLATHGGSDAIIC